MNIYLEILLRALGVFLGVFFTVSWGRKSKPVWDVFAILAAVVIAVILAFRQPGTIKTAPMVSIPAPPVISTGPSA